MSSLFIERYLDADVDVLIADLVRARGFVASTTYEAGEIQSSDVLPLAYAVSQRKTFLTDSRADFDTLAQTYFAAGQTRYGIITARCTPYEIARHLLLLLNQVTVDEIQNQIRYI